MAKPFDLKKQLKLHDKGLLRRLFADKHRVLTDVPWEGLKPAGGSGLRGPDPRGVRAEASGDSQSSRRACRRGQVL